MLLEQELEGWAAVRTVRQLNQALRAGGLIWHLHFLYFAQPFPPFVPILTLSTFKICTESMWRCVLLPL